MKELKHMVFVQDSDELEKFYRSVKLEACPFCKHTGTLNRHSVMFGNDPERNTGSIARGQRVFCSDRGRRGGCGRTFPVFFAWVLPRHSFSATLIWRAIDKWLSGLSVRASWLPVKTPLALDSFYHLLQRLRRRIGDLRTILSAAGRPPESGHSDALLQTFEHMLAACPDKVSPAKAFQLKFQAPLTG
jgi:hypothetical protein